MGPNPLATFSAMVTQTELLSDLNKIILKIIILGKFGLVTRAVTSYKTKLDSS
jgi:hypothetical protein